MKGLFDGEEAEQVNGDASNKQKENEEDKNRFLKPSVKAKPWHLKSLFREKSPFRKPNTHFNGNQLPSDTVTSSSPLPTATSIATPPRTATPPVLPSRNPPPPHSPNLSPEISHPTPDHATNSISRTPSDPNYPPQHHTTNRNSNSIPTSTSTRTMTNANANANATAPGRMRPLQVHGIFFDETPNLYSAAKLGYLDEINRYVRNATGIGGEKLVSRHFLLLSSLLRSCHFIQATSILFFSRTFIALRSPHRVMHFLPPLHDSSQGLGTANLKD